jgi:hypothetical protein
MDGTWREESEAVLPQKVLAHAGLQEGHGKYPANFF